MSFRSSPSGPKEQFPRKDAHAEVALFDRLEYLNQLLDLLSLSRPRTGGAWSGDSLAWCARCAAPSL